MQNNTKWKYVYIVLSKTQVNIRYNIDRKTEGEYMPISKERYKKIRDNEEKSFSIKDFLNVADRTLLYGYTLERQTVHVYIKDREVHYFEYDLNGDTLFHKSGKFDYLDELIPSKRAYPESTDPEFLSILVKNGLDNCFTTYDQERYEKIKDKEYQGLIWKEN